MIAGAGEAKIRPHKEETMAGKDWARLAVGAILALGVSVGAYLGSAQQAGSAPNRAPRVVTMQVGDVAVLGARVRCLGRSDSRSGPLRHAYMRCSKRPASQARYTVDVSPEGITVWRVGSTEPLYTTPR